jgi:probable phosphoglycerate mutase
MRLLIIRHAQTPANVRGELDTAFPGPGLTDLGHRQASRIPAALSHESIDGIFVSTLVRTGLTAAPLAADRGLEPVELPGIHEIEAGSLELATDHESYRAYLGAALAWGTGDRDVLMPGGSNGHDFFERFDSSVEQIANSQVNTAVLVSHGAAIRVWVAATANNIEPHFVTEQELENTAMVVLEGSPTEGWSLAEWRGEPLGGHGLADDAAEDPTGEPLEVVPTATTGSES